VSEPPPLRTRLVCRITARLGEPQEIGEILGGRRRVVPIAGGSISGPALDGEILPGGADWQMVARDGSVAVEARYTIRAADGGLILVHSRGVRNGDPEVLTRLLAGESPDAGEYYFRTLVTLESAAPAHAWVNGRLFIAVAARDPAAVIIDLHEVM
jgi:Protein of unknown function (DUF3237)